MLPAMDKLRCIDCDKPLPGKSRRQLRCARCRKEEQARLQRERRARLKAVPLAERGSGTPCRLCAFPTAGRAEYHDECRQVVWIVGLLDCRIGRIVGEMAAAGLPMTAGLVAVKRDLTTAGNRLNRLGAYPRNGGGR